MLYDVVRGVGSARKLYFIHEDDDRARGRDSISVSTSIAQIIFGLAQYIRYR